jgi:hypothetical protein
MRVADRKGVIPDKRKPAASIYYERTYCCKNKQCGGDIFHFEEDKRYYPGCEPEIEVDWADDLIQHRPGALLQLSESGPTNAYLHQHPSDDGRPPA